MVKPKKSAAPSAAGAIATRRLEWSALAVLLTAFFLHARHFEFIQDDSFITFRYISNFLGGNGLVFNVGEHVEGYTTLLWALVLALPAKLGIDLISASRYLGVAFGLASLYVLFRLSQQVAPERRGSGFSLIAPGLLAVNGAAAYWSISGLETALFTFLAVLSVLCFLREKKKATFGFRAPLAFFLLSLSRPEGMLLFGVTAIYFFIETMSSADRLRNLGRLALWSALYIVPMGAFMVWRLSYYGYLFPNTFYAKAGLSREYLSAGIEYAWMFAKNYLLGGALLVLPVLGLAARRRWRGDLRYLFVLSACYMGYVIAIGGDVLPAFRFFIPVLPFIYLFVQESVRELHAWSPVHRPGVRVGALVLPFVLAAATFAIPYDYLTGARLGENSLVWKMAQAGKWIKAHAAPGTVIAASTIGALSYYSEVTLIDMLGLTDETIAHHPEKIFGVESSWKERNYNVTYVLSRKPDWICFSTGIKPSAFAERALFTREEFRRWYFPYYFHPSADAANINIMYRRSDAPRSDAPAGADSHTDNEFINYYYEGVNRKRQDPSGAMVLFQKALEVAPADFALLYQDMADVYASQGNSREALENYRHALAIDGRMVLSHLELGSYAMQERDFGTAKGHLEALVKLDPDYSPGWTYLGMVYDSTGDVPSAINAYRRASQTTPNDSSAYNALRRLLARTAIRRPA